MHLAARPSGRMRGIRKGRTLQQLQTGARHALAEVPADCCRICLTGIMPPRTVVRCPACQKPFDSESALRLHRAHRSNRHLACFLQPQLGARISTWGGRGGRLETVDLRTMYGLGTGEDRSPSPDPGDDLNPPPDFNEDDLGGPAQGPLAQQPVMPVQPPVCNTSVSICMYSLVLACIHVY